MFRFSNPNITHKYETCLYKKSHITIAVLYNLLRTPKYNFTTYVFWIKEQQTSLKNKTETYYKQQRKVPISAKI